MNRLTTCLVVLLVLFAVGQTHGATVLPGFDLLTTTFGTEFNPDGPGPLPPIPFVGVPLDPFDFGGGPEAVGTTDTIVERLAPASGPGIDTIPIEMVSLQLVSVVPVPLDPFGVIGEVDFIAVTLSSDRGRDITDPGTGALSTGLMGIDFDTHTFSSVIDLVYDIRRGSVLGPILAPDNVDSLVNEDPIVWVDTLPSQYAFAPDAIERSNLIPDPVSYHKFTITVVGGDVPLQIPGVNDGFLPLIVAIPSVPEPSTFTLALMGVLMLSCHGRRRRRR